MAYGESIGHVIDDVTWTWKVKVVDQIYWDGMQYLEER